MGLIRLSSGIHPIVTNDKYSKKLKEKFSCLHHIVGNSRELGKLETLLHKLSIITR